VTDIPLLGRLASLGRPRVLVLGDVMLDEYWWGSAERLSPEGPVPILSLEERTYAPGGAANVARNLLALGGRPVLLGTVGDDASAAILRRLLEEAGLDSTGLVVEPGRTTPLKVRLGTRAQALLRVDEERPWPIGEAAASELERRLHEELPRMDAAIVSDYGKGVAAAPLLAALVREARAAGIDVIADPKGTDADRFAGVRYLVPNERELRDLAGFGWSDAAGRARAAREVRARAGAEAVVLTRSEQGVELHGDGEPVALATRAREVYDVTGAGDTFVAGLALGLAGGLGLAESAALGNLAAGVKVAKRGTAVVARAELEAACRRREVGGPVKRKSLEEVASVVDVLRREGRRIVFTNGCFDLLHAGHVRYLQASRALGDCLVLALNSDASVRRLKGPGRPILALEERLQVLSALACVDYLVPFDEDTPVELIRRLRPAVLTKGADYTLERVVGADSVAAYGGRVELIPLEAGQSTTRLIDRIRATPGLPAARRAQQQSELPVERRARPAHRKVERVPDMDR
jgi:D-beta-D-heptose 7-phosphate kinase/D-beta-D-heptose 1-phosphate adenosyltransferase